jgi:adenine phosphoribosyltransferase
MDLKKYIIDVADFPQKGVVFKDVTPLLNDAAAFKYTIDELKKFVEAIGANVIVAPEARGFLFAPALAYATDTRFVLVRKPGKLPRAVHDVAYALEYGSGHLQMHIGDLKSGDKVVIIDDVLATGGTMNGIVQLCEMEQDVTVAGIACLIDLSFLHDDSIPKKYQTKALITY